jgi:hypothetical protein
MGTTQHNRLDLEEDQQFRRRFRQVQNVVLALMAIFLAAGMLGLLGGAGPFASNTVGDAGNHFTVEYPRFLRNRAPIDIAIYINAEAVANQQVSIEIDRHFIERYDIQYINPEPAEVQASDQSMIYIFEIGDLDTRTSITFNIQPERFGYAEGTIRLGDESEVRFWQLIYP